MEKPAGSHLNTNMFEILLSLSGGDLHGYAIMKEIQERSGGEVKLGPTSLYRSLKKLLVLGYIQEIDGEAESEGDERRRIYHLLDRGREAAARRAESLSRSIEVARQRRLIPGGGAS